MRMKFCLLRQNQSLQGIDVIRQIIWRFEHVENITQTASIEQQKQQIPMLIPSYFHTRSGADVHAGRLQSIPSHNMES
jgi:hypothetical protein